MERVFLDANVLFSAAWRPDSDLAQLWRLPDVSLLSSEYAQTEAERNLPAEKLPELARLLAAVTLIGEVPERDLSIDLPEKDKPIMLAAIYSGSTVLLTGDVRHFGPFYGRTVEGVLILPPGQFLARQPPAGPAT